MKGNITLTLRIPPERAISIVNRLYGSGVFTRQQMIAFVKKINQDAEKIKKREIIPENPRVFYKSYKKTPILNRGKSTEKEGVLWK